MPMFLMIAGAAVSAVGEMKAGDAQAAAGKQANKIAQQEAAASIDAGNYESREKRKEGTRAMASRIANAYATGGVISGSKLIGVIDEAGGYEADARMISRNYGLQATSLRNQGALAKWTGQMNQSASRIRAGGTILSAAGRMYGDRGVKTGQGATTNIPTMQGKITDTNQMYNISNDFLAGR